MLLNILKHRNSEKFGKLLSHNLKKQNKTQPNKEKRLIQQEKVGFTVRQMYLKNFRQVTWPSEPHFLICNVGIISTMQDCCEN